jgi:CRP-like cAMP-binding protein
MGVRSELAELGTRTSFVFDVTQGQIADALGLTPVHVNRVLGVLRAEALITLQSRRIDVPDWDQLASLAEFDPAFLLLPHGAAAPR